MVDKLLQWLFIIPIWKRLKIYSELDLKLFIVQFVKFGIVGLSNTLINLCVYYFLIYLKFHYIFANSAGFLISVVNAYYWNQKYVFKKSCGKRVNNFFRMLATYFATFLLSTLLLYLMVQILYVSEVIAPILILLITIPLNFLVNKFWAFQDTIKEKKHDE